MIKKPNKIRSWLKAIIIITLFIGLTIIVLQVTVLSQPKPFQHYLEFLDKSAQRGQNVTVYTKSDFAKKYLGADNNFKEANFLKLFKERLNYPEGRENLLFVVYQIPNNLVPCQINIIGVSKKKDLVYVSSGSACQRNDNQTK
ncbi:MAG: hypothetical protein ACOYMB_02080 [Patescibacteria group bacterium]